jgi:CheY-like chemotaxis protein
MKTINTTCIIDDDPIFIYGIQRHLKTNQFCTEIIVYENGKKAYDSLKEKHENDLKLPDLILLDINMPIWDGWQFLDEFVKMPIQQKIVIFVVSSSVLQEDFEKAKSYELVSNFIVKPITEEKIKESIESYF